MYESVSYYVYFQTSVWYFILFTEFIVYKSEKQNFNQSVTFFGYVYSIMEMCGYGQVNVMVMRIVWVSYHLKESTRIQPILKQRIHVQES